jgi:hypothetical protein
MMNMETGNFESAHQWYAAALAKQPNNVHVLEGYCNLLLAEGSM